MNGIGSFTFLCLFEVSTDRDDPIGSRHLELVVDVTRTSDELGKSRSSEDYVVRSPEGDHLKRDVFCSEVVRTTKGDF